MTAGIKGSHIWERKYVRLYMDWLQMWWMWKRKSFPSLQIKTNTNTVGRQRTTQSRGKKQNRKRGLRADAGMPQLDTLRSGRKSNCYHLRIEITSSLPLTFASRLSIWGVNLCHGNSSPRDELTKHQIVTPADLSSEITRRKASTGPHGRTLGLVAGTSGQDTI